jgi:hypothetical protein
MANLIHFRKPEHVGFLEGLGQKAKHVAEIAGTVKGIWDVGKTVYSGIQTAAPYIEALMAAGL